MVTVQSSPQAAPPAGQTHQALPPLGTNKRRLRPDGKVEVHHPRWGWRPVQSWTKAAQLND